MPAWVISLVSVMVGGVIAMLGNVVQDSLKHSREKKSTASALAASIQGSLDMVERRQYIQFFEHNLAALRQGVPLQFGRIVAYENLIDPIADRYLDRLGLFDVHGDTVIRVADLEASEHGAEKLTVLGDIDALVCRSEYLDPGGRQRLGKVDGGLTAELHNHALDRRFVLDDVQDILNGQRFEVKPVRRIEIRADRLGVVVDDNRLVAGGLERPHAVDAPVIELDSLTDANGSAAQHDSLLLRG